MARQRYKAEQIIEAIKATRGLITLAAEKLGCEPHTVYNYINRYPKVKDAIVEARTRTVDLAELKLMDAVNKAQPWAIALVLRTIGKDRGYTERHELTGKDGEALEQTIIILPDNQSAYIVDKASK